MSILIWIFVVLLIVVWLGGAIFFFALFNLAGPVDGRMFFEALGWPIWLVRSWVSRIFRD